MKNPDRVDVDRRRNKYTLDAWDLVWGLVCLLVMVLVHFAGKG